MIRPIVLIMTFLCMCVNDGTAGDGRRMLTYKVMILDVAYEFSLPEEMASLYGQSSDRLVFNPERSDFKTGGFFSLLSVLYDVKKSFFSGALGSVKFFGIVQKRDRAWSESISTREGLRKYVEWWIPRSKFPARQWRLGQDVINGREIVYRESGIVDVSSTEPVDSVFVISIPINEDMFLEFGFQIKEWKSFSSGRRQWLDHARRMRDETIRSVR